MLRIGASLLGVGVLLVGAPSAHKPNAQRSASVVWIEGILPSKQAKGPAGRQNIHRSASVSLYVGVIVGIESLLNA